MKRLLFLISVFLTTASQGQTIYYLDALSRTGKQSIAPGMSVNPRIHFINGITREDWHETYVSRVRFYAEFSRLSESVFIPGFLLNVSASGRYAHSRFSFGLGKILHTHRVSDSIALHFISGADLGTYLSHARGNAPELVLPRVTATGVSLTPYLAFVAKLGHRLTLRLELPIVLQVGRAFYDYQDATAVQKTLRMPARKWVTEQHFFGSGSMLGIGWTF